jgi:hypothetical protein
MGQPFPQALGMAARVQQQYGHARGGAVDPQLYDLDPAEVATWERESGPLGSNAGGLHRDAQGRQFYLKSYSGVSGDDRARNEKLASELYKLVGVPVADTKLTEWKGRTALASRIIAGEKLAKFEPKSYPHIRDLLEHYPADAWLANYDVAGTNHNNIIVAPNNRAGRIDNGGALRYKATGDLKSHFGDDATDELFNLGNEEHNKWAAKLYKDAEFGKDSPGYQTALNIAWMPDDYIRSIVGVYGPQSRKDNDELADKIIARRNSIAKAYGIEESEYQRGGAVNFNIDENDDEARWWYAPNPVEDNPLYETLAEWMTLYGEPPDLDAPPDDAVADEPVDEEEPEEEAKRQFGGGTMGAENFMERMAARNLFFEGYSAEPRDINAATGSYVLSPDVTSTLGQGNSQTGGYILSKMFSSGPYGVQPLRSAARVSPPRLSGLGPPRSYGPRPPHYAKGGATGSIVPVTVAAGSYTIPPQVVRDLGHGSLKAGEKVLDAFVRKVRDEAGQKKLPPPRQ